MSPTTFYAQEDINLTIFNYVGPPIRMKKGDIVVFQILEPPLTSQIIKFTKADPVVFNPDS
jgi:hypothetical protein